MTQSLSHLYKLVLDAVFELQDVLTLDFAVIFLLSKPVLIFLRLFWTLYLSFFTFLAVLASF